MGKVLALDVGDVWTGVAISDPLKILAKPYQTYQTEHLHATLREIFHEHDIERVVVGFPKTLKGTESQQTQQVRDQFTHLTDTFPEIPFVLWDERLSSKRAQELPTKTSNRKEDKRWSHARAAAFILDTYLQAHYGSA